MLALSGASNKVCIQQQGLARLAFQSLDSRTAFVSSRSTWELMYLLHTLRTVVGTLLHDESATRDLCRRRH